VAPRTWRGHTPTSDRKEIVTTIYDQEQEARSEYRASMREAFADIRDYAACTTTDLAPPLRRAVWLAIPAVRFGQSVRDEELDRELVLDLVAAQEYGGYFGYSADQIEDEADMIVGFWFQDRDAGSAKGGE
jgi:hypothetical protein